MGGVAHFIRVAAMIFGGSHVSLESQITLSDVETAIKQAVEMNIFVN